MYKDKEVKKNVEDIFLSMCDVKIFLTFTSPNMVRNGGLNQILKRQTSRSHYGSKVPAVTITVFKYRNKIGKIVVKAVPYSVT
jgi:hypothetical protein